MRSLLLLFGAFLYIGALLAAHPPRREQAPRDLTVSMLAQDTDTDDDVLEGACLHSHSLDDGFQNFDCTRTPSIAFRAEARRLCHGVTPARERLDEGGLFRPPRASLV